MRKAGKIIRHFRRQGNNIHITNHIPIRKPDRIIFFQISDPKPAPNKVVGFFNDYDKVLTFGWQMLWVGVASIKYQTTSDEFKDFRKKYYAYQRGLITAIAGLNKDSGKVVEEKEVIAGKATAAAQVEGEKNETTAAAAQEDIDRNESAAAASATAQEDADKNESASAAAAATK